MITDLEITNFESHADTSLSLSPGVNVIVGLSDAGKSALFRSINWALFNKPSGDAFIRKGAKTACVSVTLDGQTTITRQKGGAGNAYYLNDQLFEAFGSSVPDAIQEAINMDRSVNVQAQIDPIFLIQQSPGEIARHWNEAAGLDEIDRSISNLASQERQTNARIKEQDKRVKELDEALGAYEGIDEIDERLRQAESVEKDLGEKEKMKGAIDSRADSLREAHGRTESHRLIAAYEEQVNKALQLSETVKEYRAENAKLAKTAEEYRNHQARLQRLRQIVDQAEAVGKIEDELERLGELRSELSRLRSVYQSVSDCQGRIESHREDIESLEQDWHEIAPDQCPLCEGTGKLK